MVAYLDASALVKHGKRARLQAHRVLTAMTQVPATDGRCWGGAPRLGRGVRALTTSAEARQAKRDLPDAVASGREPLQVVGAMAGG